MGERRDRPRPQVRPQQGGGYHSHAVGEKGRRVWKRRSGWFLEKFWADGFYFLKEVADGWVHPKRRNNLGRTKDRRDKCWHSVGNRGLYGAGGEGGSNAGVTRETGGTKRFLKAKGVSIRKKRVNAAVRQNRR